MDEMLGNARSFWENPLSPTQAVTDIAFRSDPEAQKQMLLDAAKLFLGLTPTAIAPVGLRQAEQQIIELNPAERLVRSDYLLWEAAILGGILLAPVVYRAANAPRKGKRGQRQEEIASALDSSSNRAVSLLAAIGPAIAFPAAYITVQGLENRGVISKGLGDDVQTLMATLAGGQAASGIINAVAKAI